MVLAFDDPVKLNFHPDFPGFIEHFIGDFHWCPEVLHLMICPAFLSVFTGACYAYRFQGQITKSILAAGVLFFAPRRKKSLHFHI
jgi:hypothetical protein